MVSFGNIYAFISVHPGWDWWGQSNLYLNNEFALSNGTALGGDDELAVRAGYAKWTQCDDRGIEFVPWDSKIWTGTDGKRIYVEGQGQRPLRLCNMTETAFHRVTQLDRGTVVRTYSAYESPLEL